MIAASPRQRRLALAAWMAVCLIWGTTYSRDPCVARDDAPVGDGGDSMDDRGYVIAIYLVGRGERLPDRRGWWAVLSRLHAAGARQRRGRLGRAVRSERTRGCPGRRVAVLDDRRRSDALRRRSADAAGRGGAGGGILRNPAAGLAGFDAGGAGHAGPSGGCGRAADCVSRLDDRIVLFAAARAARERAQRDSGADAGGGPDDARSSAPREGNGARCTFRRAARRRSSYLGRLARSAGSWRTRMRSGTCRFRSSRSYAYMNPVIAVALGVALLGEPFNRAQRPRGCARLRRRRDREDAASPAASVPVRAPPRAGDPVAARGQTVRPLIRRTRNSTIAMTSRM